ncbi:MAG: sel1 repeat family protein [Gammaproteobacteria bacterium]|nr:sel1 repeat family protein [Gammaproteobacteria bacterium]
MISYKTASKLLQKAAKSDHTKSIYMLGWVYSKGMGVEKNNDIAIRYLNIASSRGVENAGSLLRLIQKNEILQHAPADAYNRRGSAKILTAKMWLGVLIFSENCTFIAQIKNKNSK